MTESHEASVTFVSPALWNALSYCIHLEKPLFTGGVCIFQGIHHSWLKGIIFALTCFSWWTNKQKTVHRSQCLWLPDMGNGPEFLMPYWIQSQHIAQYVRHSFCWWTGDLVSWNVKIYFIKERRCWTLNKVSRGLGGWGGVQPNVDIWSIYFLSIESHQDWGWSFPNFFMGHSVSLLSLKCLAID